VFTKEVAHLFDEFNTDTRVATNQGIHADQDGTPNPRFRHGRVVERVEERKRITLFGGDYAVVLVL
jgi:hypothetical protein